MGRPEKNPLSVGDRAGRLTVMTLLGLVDGNTSAIFRCDCGDLISMPVKDVKSGNTKSCGCAQRDAIRALGKSRTTHGHRRGGVETPEYRAWHQMLMRCCNKKHPAYKDYGGRGIGVFGKWKLSFQTFFSHIGKRPSSAHTLGRIRNGAGYVPGNVEWQTMKEQSRNRRSNRLLKIDGRLVTISELAERLGVYRSTVRRRLELGWSPEKIISIPVDHRKGNHR